MEMNFKNKDQEKYFNKFKSEKIDENTLNKAEHKANKLKKSSSSFLLLIEMVKSHLSGKFKIPTKELAIIIGAIVYVVSPIDAVVDLIPFVGYVDDATVIGIALKALFETIEKYKKYKESNSNA